MKELKRVDSRHMKPLEDGDRKWFRNKTCEIYIILDSEDNILNFHIKDQKINFRFQVNQQLKVGTIDSLHAVTKDGQVKPPASTLIRNEKIPNLSQIETAIKVINHTPDLEPHIRAKLLAILHATEIL